MNPSAIKKKNAERRACLNEDYNQVTGVGCNGERFLFSLSDSPIGDIWIPVEMKDIEAVRILSAAGSIYSWLDGMSVGEEERGELFFQTWTAFCELRMDYDFEYFAYSAETIKDKITGSPGSFCLNRGQRKLLNSLENMRKGGLPIRVILLKARQWGGSTLTQMYMYWVQVKLRMNWNSVICAHTRDAAINIRAMYKLCVDEMSPLNGEVYDITPFEGAVNVKQIEKRGCRITVGSAESPESVRSQDVKMAHFSEVAYYPKTANTNAKQLVTSIVSSIPLQPYTMVVYESTANGVGDFFHSEYVRAHEGLSSYEAVFVSWFENGDLYTSEFEGFYYDHNGRRQKGGADEFIGEMSDYELNLFSAHEDVTLEHLNWYRQMKSQLEDDMQKEYPSDWIEAFQHSGEMAFRADDIEKLRDGCSVPPIAVGVMTADGDAAMSKMGNIPMRSLVSGVRFVEDGSLLDIACSRSMDAKVKERKLNNKLLIWSHPEKGLAVKRRYIVVFDPARGVTGGADWGVIVVLDRYWRMYGGKTEVVAEWRGHADKDIAAWTAVQIAKYYDDALLVIESNTFDSDYRKEDDTEFILKTISDYYGNLYSRTDATKVKEGAPLKYGFHTNKTTKPAIISDYVSTLREGSYIERSSRTLDQARVYERKENGSYGSKEGFHDDDLITRMIGLYVDFRELRLPELVEGSAANKSLTRELVNESSF